MSLDFGTESDQREVDFGTLDSDNMSQGTILGWLYPTDLTGEHCICAKSEAAGRLYFAKGDDGLNFVRERATISTQVGKWSGIFTVNAWNFYAAVWDTAGADGDQHLYHADWGDLAEEVVGYDEQKVGSGALRDITAMDFIVGQRGAENAWWFAGRMGTICYFNQPLTLGQIRVLQPRILPMFSGCKLLCYFGLHGTGSQPDLSGNGNNGTVTGCPLADRVPLGPPFGFDIGLPFLHIAAPPPAQGMPIMYRRRRRQIHF